MQCGHQPGSPSQATVSRPRCHFVLSLGAQVVVAERRSHPRLVLPPPLAALPGDLGCCSAPAAAAASQQGRDLVFCCIQALLLSQEPVQRRCFSWPSPWRKKVMALMALHTSPDT
ncbi:unnamed protein product [Lepidochelys olivacea]